MAVWVSTLTDPLLSLIGPVACRPGLVLDRCFGRARSLILYRGTYQEKPVLAVEYAPLALVERQDDGSLKGIGDLAMLSEGASRWQQWAMHATIWTDESGSRTIGKGRKVQSVTGLDFPNWFILPIEKPTITSLAEWVGSGDTARPLGRFAAASLTRALAQDMLLTHQAGRANLNISPVTLLQCDPHESATSTQALAPLPDEFGLMAPNVYNLGIPRHYASPEMRDGSGRLPVGSLSDIYSASAVIAYAISGEPPPDFATGIDPARWLADHPVARQHPPEFRAAIAAGLAVSPRQRPQDVAEWFVAFDLGSMPEKGDMLTAGWQWAADQATVVIPVGPLTGGEETQVEPGNDPATGNFDANGAPPPPIEPTEPPTGESEPTSTLETGSGVGSVLFSMFLALGAAFVAVGLATWMMDSIDLGDDWPYERAYRNAVAAGLLALFAAFAASRTRAANKSRRSAWAALAVALPLALFFAAVAASEWSALNRAYAEEATEPADASASADGSIAEEPEPDLSELSRDGVFDLGGIWIDLNLFVGGYRRADGNCLDRDFSLNFGFDPSYEAMTPEGPMWARMPDGTVFNLVLTNSTSASQPGQTIRLSPENVSRGADSSNRSQAALDALRAWRSASSQTVEFTIDSVSLPGSTRVNPNPPNRAILTRRGDALSFSVGYAGDAASFETNDFVKCVQEPLDVEKK